MKYKIKYYPCSSFVYPCWAETIIQGETILGCGGTWKEARSHLLDRIKRIEKASIAKASIPQPEEVEL